MSVSRMLSTEKGRLYWHHYLEAVYTLWGKGLFEPSFSYSLVEVGLIDRMGVSEVVRRYLGDVEGVESDLLESVFAERESKRNRAILSYEGVFKHQYSCCRACTERLGEVCLGVSCSLDLLRYSGLENVDITGRYGRYGRLWSYYCPTCGEEWVDSGLGVWVRDYQRLELVKRVFEVRLVMGRGYSLILSPSKRYWADNGVGVLVKGGGGGGEGVLERLYFE